MKIAKPNVYIDYCQRMIAQEVHIRGIGSFDDLAQREQNILLSTCKDLLSSMIKREHVKQYGKQNSGVSL